MDNINDMKEKIENDGVLLEHYSTDIIGSNSGIESIYFYKNRFYIIGTCGKFEGTCGNCNLDDCDMIHKGFIVTELVRKKIADIELIMRLETDYKDKILSVNKISDKISVEYDKTTKGSLRVPGKKISKKLAEYLISNKALVKGFTIVCKGWSADSDYQEITDEYLDEENKFDDDYFDFQIWKG